MLNNNKLDPASIVCKPVTSRKRTLDSVIGEYSWFVRHMISFLIQFESDSRHCKSSGFFKETIVTQGWVLQQRNSVDFIGEGVCAMLHELEAELAG